VWDIKEHASETGLDSEGIVEPVDPKKKLVLPDLSGFKEVVSETENERGRSNESNCATHVFEIDEERSSIKSSGEFLDITDFHIILLFSEWKEIEPTGSEQKKTKTKTRVDRIVF
jgi:hypothetical protein